MKFLLSLYRFFLHLYPTPFRRLFSSEMEQVFLQSLAEARLTSRRQLATRLLEEVLDFPSGLFQAYLSSLKGAFQPAFEAQFVGETSSSSSLPPASWTQAFLGGLPQFLIGLVQGLPMVLISAGLLPSQSFLSYLLPAVVVLSLVGSFVLYFRFKHPRWTSAWYFYWFLAANGIFGLIFDQFSPTHQWSEVITWPLISTALLLLIAYTLYRITTRDRLRGLLAAIPVMMTVWAINLEFVPDGPEGVNWLATSLLAGLICMLLLKVNRSGLGLILVIGMTALAGLPYSYLGTYLGGTLSFSEPGPSLWAVWNSFTPMLGVTAALALGPQLALTLREIGRSSGKIGQTAYRTALSGLLITLTCVVLLTSTITSSGPMQFLRTQSASTIIQLGIALGILIYTAGFFLLLSASHQNNPPLIDAPMEIMLFLTALGVPLIVLGFLSPMSMLHEFPAWIRAFMRPTSDVLTQLNVWFYPVWVALSVWVILVWNKKLDPRQSLVRTV